MNRISFRSAVIIGLAIYLLMSVGTSAEPTWGVGLSFVPGSGFAIGIKVISDDEENSSYGSLGIDYLIADTGNGRWRPNLGIGYQSTSIFGEVNTGYRNGKFDLGVSAGYLENDAPPRPPPVRLAHPT